MGAVQSITMSMSVCLFVCPLAYLENHTTDLYPFLRRDAMLARYMLSLCVSPSVRHKSVFYEDVKPRIMQKAVR